MDNIYIYHPIENGRTILVFKYPYLTFSQLGPLLAPGGPCDIY